MPAAAILRLTKVIYEGFPLFEQWKTKLKSGQPIHPFFDMFFAPIERRKVLQTIDHLATHKKVGVFQLSANADISYGAYAKKLAKELQVDSKLVQPKSAKECGFPLEQRPKNTSLQSNIYPI